MHRAASGLTNWSGSQSDPEHRNSSSRSATRPDSSATPHRQGGAEPANGLHLERADVTSNTYWDWYISKAYLIGPAQRVVTSFLETFRDFPPRQRPAAFTIDQAVEKMQSVLGSGLSP